MINLPKFYPPTLFYLAIDFFCAKVFYYTVVNLLDELLVIKGMILTGCLSVVDS